jgi:hypothetical protein
VCVCIHLNKDTHARMHARTHARYTAPYKQDKRATYTVGHHNHLDISGGLIAVVHVLNSVWQRLGPRILPQAIEDPVGALGVIGNLPAHRVRCAWPSTHVGICMASNVKKCISHQMLNKIVIRARSYRSDAEWQVWCTFMASTLLHVSLAHLPREKMRRVTRRPREWDSSESLALNPPTRPDLEWGNRSVWKRAHLTRRAQWNLVAIVVGPACNEAVSRLVKLAS